MSVIQCMTVTGPSFTCYQMNMLGHVLKLHSSWRANSHLLSGETWREVEGPATAVLNCPLVYSVPGGPIVTCSQIIIAVLTCPVIVYTVPGRLILSWQVNSPIIGRELEGGEGSPPLTKTVCPEIFPVIYSMCKCQCPSSWLPLGPFCLLPHEYKLMYTVPGGPILSFC